MAKYVTVKEQQWETTALGGLEVKECPLWEGGHDVYAGYFRLPKGLQFPKHYHKRWVSIYVMSGALRVKVADAEAMTMTAGDYYFVEPGDPHIEAALEDTVALVVTAENREDVRYGLLAP